MIALPRLAALLFGLIIFCPSIRADDTDKIFAADLQRLFTAVKTNDFDTPIDMMYSPVLEASGGRDAMRKEAGQLKEKFSAIGLKYVSMDSVPPYQRVTTTANDYVIIPTHIVIDAGLHRFETNGYELAIKAHHSSKWEYMDGAGITPEMRSSFFPDLKDTVLPEVKRKKLY